MNPLLLLTSLLSTTLATTLNEGISPRIVNGYEVSPKFKYPFIVSLKLRTWIVCGGTLYNKNKIITAAHCMIAEKEDWTALYHRHNIKLNSTQENGKEFTVVDRVMHPKYIDSPTGYDISIWTINEQVNDFNNVVLDENKLYLKEDRLLKVIGWGTVAKSGNYSDVLLETKLPIFNFDKCKAIYKQLDVSEFCAGFVDGSTDTCQGDSGGPIFINQNKKNILVGIISRGEGCAKIGYPGVYTAIGEVRDFIDKYI